MSSERGRDTGSNGADREAAEAMLDNGRGALLKARLTYLERSQRALGREARRIPWLSLVAILAIPAGLYWGPFAAFSALATAVTLTIVGAYISWAHRNEYSDQESMIRQQLA